MIAARKFICPAAGHSLKYTKCPAVKNFYQISPESLPQTSWNYYIWNTWNPSSETITSSPGCSRPLKELPKNLKAHGKERRFLLQCPTSLCALLFIPFGISLVNGWRNYIPPKPCRWWCSNSCIGLNECVKRATCISGSIHLHLDFLE